MATTARNLLLICLCVSVPFLSFITPSFSQGPSLLKGGIEQYQEENYEEAAEILEEARKLYPKSSPAAFFLGMTYP